MLDIVVSIAMIIIVFIVHKITRANKPCIDKNCDGTMYGTYVGDGDGGYYDFIHYRCNKCDKIDDVLVG